MRAVVVGAGIGGLAAAAGLRRAGHEVVVLERAEEVAAVGAGISLWPNAINALGRLGLREAVLAAGEPVRSGGIHTWRGAPLVADDLTTYEERFGAPLMVLHRADLHRILLGAVGPAVVRTGAEVVGVEGTTARLADGSVEAGDVLIGADGIRSTVRAAVLGDGAPRYAGVTAWRAVTPLDAALLARVRDGEYWGHGRLFGIVRMAGERAYWFACARAPEGERGTDALSAYASWADPISDLIAATDPAAILRNDLYDRPPSGPWGRGRVTLVGDAAHPMLPNLGQGACQALEDSVALADALRPGVQRPDDAIPVETDLRAYESARMARAHAIVRQSRRVGRMAVLDGPVREWLRNRLLRSIPAGARARQAAAILEAPS